MLRGEVEMMGRKGTFEDDRIVERSASLMRICTENLFLTSGGGEVRQRLDMLAPDAMVIAHAGGITQRRSTGARGLARQGGWEVLDSVDFRGIGGRFRDQALQLLAAPDCPVGPRDLLLAPDQMMLQIHESIGHPLELDRILGDERNYAGTSFVTADMFGSYRYGSELLDVTFDPGVPGEFASYAFDDEGAAAQRTYLIKDGIVAAARRRHIPGACRHAGRCQCAGQLVESPAHRPHGQPQRGTGHGHA